MSRWSWWPRRRASWWTRCAICPDLPQSCHSAATSPRPRHDCSPLSRAAHHGPRRLCLLQNRTMPQARRRGAGGHSADHRAPAQGGGHPLRVQLPAIYIPSPELQPAAYLPQVFELFDQLTLFSASSHVAYAGPPLQALEQVAACLPSRAIAAACFPSRVVLAAPRPPLDLTLISP